jgi:hypothetical protein
MLQSISRRHPALASQRDRFLPSGVPVSLLRHKKTPRPSLEAALFACANVEASALRDALLI